MIKHAFYIFEFGILKVSYTESGVIGIRTVEKTGGKDEHSQLSDTVYEQICEYMAGKRTSFDFPYVLNGTEFQKRVWEELCKIPYGETRTYKQIAEAIGSPKSSRAVGAANGKNPVWIAVPCHRVIGANGSLTGYAGGLEFKKALLELEKHEKEKDRNAE